MLTIMDIPDNIVFNFINDDFLLHKFEQKYDLVIGNPPFLKLAKNNKKLKEYRKYSINDESNNTSSYFLEKSTMLGENIVMIMPKFLLNTAEYEKTRKYLENFSIKSILDFGEKGFNGVLIETICISINMNEKINYTKIVSVTNNIIINQLQKNITDPKLPYWIIYRDEYFDRVFNKMKFNIFNVFRDRQITNNNTNKENNGIWVIKSRNISDDGSSIKHICDYDQYIEEKNLINLSVNNFMNVENVYLTPNMTYKPRVCKMPKGVIVNGSVAILIPQNNEILTQEDMNYYSSEEYRKFYKIARNYQTRSLNIDKTSVFFFGKLREV